MASTPKRLPTFIENHTEPFDGALIILNIGEENIKRLSLSTEYMGKISEAIKFAHAKGHIVLYLFDTTCGVMPRPDDFPSLDGADASALLNTLTQFPNTNFSENPIRRMATFREIAIRIFESGAFPFSSLIQGAWRITGNCQINSTNVILPVTTIDPLVLDQAESAFETAIERFDLETRDEE